MEYLYADYTSRISQSGMFNMFLHMFLSAHLLNFLNLILSTKYN